MLDYVFKAREAAKRLGTDNNGLMSFEYVIVAACIVGATAAAFGGAGASTIQGALTGGLTVIANAITAAV